LKFVVGFPRKVGFGFPIKLLPVKGSGGTGFDAGTPDIIPPPSGIEP
jgi:hypothetical protein